MSGYTKLWQTLLTSTVWGESTETRVVWITMLALADRDGNVEATVPGLARLASVSIEAVEAALRVFQAPDRHSRSKKLAGVRIQEIDGGWFLVNHSEHRSRGSVEETREKTAARVRRHRARNGAVTGHVTECNTPGVTDRTSNAGNPIAEAEAKEEEIPLPSSEPRARPADPLAVSLGGLRPDVAALHRTWQRSTGLTGHRLRGGSTDFDAVTLAESLDLHGPEDCTTVAETCMRDRMVNGTADDAGQKHTAIRYVFGNEHAFARILKAARDARTVANPRAEADFDAAFEAEA